MINKIKYIKGAMKYSIPGWINRKKFYLNCKDILKSPAIKTTSDGVLIVSLVSRRDVLMYLVAAKSFYYYLKRGSFVIINDGSLSDDQLNICRKHIDGVKIVHINEIENKICPERGCWERLLYVAGQNKDNFVVVLDSDTLAQNPLNEIQDCIENNQSFIMAGGKSHQIEEMPIVCQKEKEKFAGQDIRDKCVQAYVDCNLDKIPDFKEQKYVKGTGGFNGYAKGSITRKQVEESSLDLEKVFGERWREWGTEQIMTCLLIANTEHARVLPYEKYPLYFADNVVEYDKASLIHFIGICRFKKNYYINQSKKIIKKL